MAKPSNARRPKKIRIPVGRSISIKLPKGTAIEKQRTQALVSKMLTELAEAALLPQSLSADKEFIAAAITLGHLQKTLTPNNALEVMCAFYFMMWFMENGGSEMAERGKRAIASLKNATQTRTRNLTEDLKPKLDELRPTVERLKADGHSKRRIAQLIERDIGLKAETVRGYFKRGLL